MNDAPDETAPRRWNTSRHRAAALIGVLTAGLGFAIAVQVNANSGSDRFANLREADLIGILDNQNARADRLRQQIAGLEQTLRQLQAGGDKAAAAETQAQQEAAALGVLLGTLPATGPGVQVTITDPRQTLQAEDLLDVIQELRGAGAEAIQFGPVRVSTTTALAPGGRGVLLIDGMPVAAPYTVLAIGDSRTLDTALNIPGGVAATVRAAGGELSVRELPEVAINAVRPIPTPKYATPTGH